MICYCYILFNCSICSIYYCWIY